MRASRAWVEIWHNVDDQGHSVPGTQHELINLRIARRTPEGDWDLYLTSDGKLRAHAEGEGPWRFMPTRRDQVSVECIHSRVPPDLMALLNGN